METNSSLAAKHKVGKHKSLEARLSALEAFEEERARLQAQEQKAAPPPDFEPQDVQKYLHLDNEVVREYLEWTVKLFARLDIPIPESLELEVAETLWEELHDKCFSSGDKYLVNAALDMEIERHGRGGSLIL